MVETRSRRRARGASDGPTAMASSAAAARSSVERTSAEVARPSAAAPADDGLPLRPPKLKPARGDEAYTQPPPPPPQSAALDVAALPLDARRVLSERFGDELGLLIGQPLAERLHGRRWR